MNPINWSRAVPKAQSFGCRRTYRGLDEAMKQELETSDIVLNRLILGYGLSQPFTSRPSSAYLPC